MTSTVVVAIPDEDDLVWKLSSEKVPHMTLLFLDDLSNDPNLGMVWEYIAHAVDSTLNKFYLDVTSRGVLGSDEADVLFFDPKYTKKLAEFRSQLLANPVIAKAYLSVDQYPHWTPHLTMGYPATPAKKPKEAYDSKLYGVRFTKIALWTGEYSGPEFPLQEKEYPGLAEEVTMSDVVEKHLAHYGIRGMRWGVRRNLSGGVEVSTTSIPGKKVIAKGGQGQPAHEDAIKTAISKQKAKASSTDALSTKDLQELVNRMNLEQQYSKLTQQKGFVDKLDADKKKVDKLIGAGQTASNVYNFVNSPFGQLIQGVFEAKTGVRLPRPKNSQARRAAK